ncbi:MAG: oligosaccharide repeat unit polymerase [Candidatus Bathyarchaeia archaeon]|nr:oligosaccharide repeat unit polymerase [Candidatus Jingweiarchaeum tengchongense]
MMLASIYFSISASIINEQINKKGIIEFFHPVIFLIFYWGIPFCLQPALIAFDLVLPELILMRSGGDQRYVPYLQIQAILALIFLYWGFNCRLQLKKRHLYTHNHATSKQKENKWDKRMGIIAVLFSLLLDTIYEYYTNITGRSIIGSEGESLPSMIYYFLKIFGHVSYGQFMTMGGSLALIVVLFSSSMDKVGIKFIVYAFMVVSITLGFLSYHKFRMLIPIVILFYSYYYWSKKRIRLKQEVILVFIIATIVITFPILQTGKRFYYMTDYRPSLGDIKEDILYIAKYIRPEDYLYLLTRFESLDNATVICSQTPSIIPYRYGQTYLAGFINFLGIFPRLAPEGAGTFSNRFAIEHSLIPPTDTKSGVTLTQISEAYMNFGIYSIPFVMFVYGMFYKKIYFYMVNARSDNAKFISLYLWYIWVFMHPGFVFESTIISFIKDGYGVAMFLIILNIPNLAFRPHTREDLRTT